VPVSHLLSIAAAQSRADAQHRVSYAIELLPTKLLAPVGTLLLPAFVITTVIPVVASLAQQFFLS
jgi:pilus assembly protein TadC